MKISWTIEACMVLMYAGQGMHQEQLWICLEFASEQYKLAVVFLHWVASCLALKIQPASSCISSF